MTGSGHGHGGATWWRRAARRLLDADPSGRLLRVQHPIFTSDPATTKTGTGAYGAWEWAAARRRAAAGLAIDSDRNWFNYLVREAATDAQAAFALVDVFPFDDYRAVLELGAGEGIHGAIVKSRFGHLRYRATDFDADVIDRDSRLSILQDLELGVLDVDKLTTHDLQGFDLVTSWAVDYALTAESLARVFRCVADAAVHYLMCTIGPTGAGELAAYVVNRRRYERLVRDGELRMHGWTRSSALLRSLARSHGLQSRVIGNFGAHHAILFQPSRPDAVRQPQ